ncbi:MAG: T9SS type A sorting domain-containing protein, partial [Crocinitomicaceae bacterium]|nr:T9SS type A sorting domain-containing protein [Crocinitomicaceae bacterium]
PSLKLINAYGVMVEPDLQYLSNKIEVDITAFPDGVYFLVVQDSEHINTAKIIKQ